MRIKQELLDNGFIVRTITESQMLKVLNYFGLNANQYDFYRYNVDTCLDCDGKSVYYGTETFYKTNVPTDKIYDFEEIWEEQTEQIDSTNSLIKAKQSIISLILDAQLQSGKRFDKFINDLPVEDEVLIDFIFTDDDYDLLLSEVFDILNYLGYEMNIIDKD